MNPSQIMQTRCPKSLLHTLFSTASNLAIWKGAFHVIKKNYGTVINVIFQTKVSDTKNNKQSMIVGILSKCFA